MRLTDRLRGAVLHHHTVEQLHGKVSQKPTAPENYVRFLEQTRLVHLTLERDPLYRDEPALNLLERADMFAEEIRAVRAHFGMPESGAVPVPGDGPGDGPGDRYVRLLRALQTTDRRKYMCHVYAIYGAHVYGAPSLTAAAQTALDAERVDAVDGWTMYSHAYDAAAAGALYDNVNNGVAAALFAGLRARMDAEAAAVWTDEDVRVCLEETPLAFARVNGLLACLTGA